MANHQPFLKGPHGTSLIGQLTSMGIAAIIIAILGGMFIVLMRTYFTFRGQADLITEASTIADRINASANPAIAIEPSRLVGVTTYTTDSDTLVLKLGAVDASSNLIANTYDYVIITPDSADPTRLLEITDANSASVRNSLTKEITSNLRTIGFTYRDAAPSTSNQVGAGLTLEHDVGFTTVHHTLHTYAKLRNT